MANPKKGMNEVIAVDARKLSLGLKTAFEGVAMVFDSLGVDACFEVEEKKPGKKSQKIEEESQKAAEKAQKAEEKAQKAAEESQKVEDEKTTNSCVETASEEEKVLEVENETEDARADATGITNGSGSNDVSSDDHADEGEMKEAVAAVPSISLDDLTKVIVQKIKQNRSNNAKIGSILKTYGVAKVSELPAEKYEAFLTDLSQI